MTASTVSNETQKLMGLLFGFILIPLLIGLVIGFTYVEKPAVGIIKMNMEVWAGSNFLVNKQIEAARQDPRIKAVVVQINSPGGEVVAGQNMYMELRKLRHEMPVVGSIDNIAASGGYYIAMATDPIFAKPSSDVGNVGVWSFAPPSLGVNDVVLASGPFKLTASSRDEFLRGIDTIKQEFMEVVYSQRGERLIMPQAELSQGLLYDGREATELGLIDQVGTHTDAIEFAAKQADLADYDVIDLQNVVFMELFDQPGPLIKPLTEAIHDPETGDILFEPWSGAANPQTGQRELLPGIYMLYDPWFGGHHD